MLEPGTARQVKDQTLAMKLSDLKSRIASTLSAAGQGASQVRHAPRRLSRFLAVAAALAVGIPAEAYYHYIHYLTRQRSVYSHSAGLRSERAAQQDHHVLRQRSGPGLYGANDTFGSVLSQIKQAAAAWNAVPNSDLRVAFGGLESSSQAATSKTPAPMWLFRTCPGLLGMGGRDRGGNGAVKTGQNGPFIPITSGLVILTNTTNPNAARDRATWKSSTPPPSTSSGTPWDCSTPGRRRPCRRT